MGVFFHLCPRCETPHRLQLNFHLVMVAGNVALMLTVLKHYTL